MNLKGSIKVGIVVNLWMVLLIFTNALCKMYIDSIGDISNTIGMVLYIITILVNVVLISNHFTKGKTEHKIKSSV